MTLEEYIKENITDKESLPFQTIPQTYKKGTRIIDIGMQENFIYYIASGIIELGLYVKNNKEIKILDFYLPGYFPSAFMAYSKNEPSDVYMTCITDCIVEKIPLKELGKAQKTSRLALQLSLHMLQKSYMLRVTKEKNFLTKSAEELYVELFKTRPEIIRQIPNSKVAKYMGIHPASLSRLKKTIHLSK
jgi:CRP-like cAMP-binding protein